MTTTTTTRAGSIRVGNFRLRPDPLGVGWVLTEMRQHTPASKHYPGEYDHDPTYPSRLDIGLRDMMERMVQADLPVDATLADAVATVERLYRTIGEAAQAHTEGR